MSVGEKNNHLPWFNGFLTRQWPYLFFAVACVTAFVTATTVVTFKDTIARLQSPDILETKTPVATQAHSIPMDPRFAMILSPAHLIGIVATEIGHELAAESEDATPQHMTGVSGIKETYVRNIGPVSNAFTVALEDALAKLDRADPNGIDNAAAVLGRFCLQERCTSVVNENPIPEYDVNARIEPPVYYDITSSLVAFNDYSKDVPEAVANATCQKLVEDWCGGGRMVVYRLMPRFHAYQNTVVKFGRDGHRDLLLLFRKGLDKEFDFTRDMIEVDAANEPHYRDVMKSIDRRRKLYDAFLKNDKEVVAKLLNEGIESIIGKIKDRDEDVKI